VNIDRDEKQRLVVKTGLSHTSSGTFLNRC
jgi:hypothetical protein